MRTVKITVPANVKSKYSSKVSYFGKLGREIRISPKAKVNRNEAGFKLSFYVPTIDIVVGIGTDHVAYLVMEEDAWKALKQGEQISIDTLKEFTNKYL